MKEVQDRSNLVKLLEAAQIADWLFYGLLIAGLLSMFSAEVSATVNEVGLLAIVVGLLRIRLIVRGTRLDALERDSGTKVVEHKPEPAQSTEALSCPKCAVPVTLPPGYAHSNAKCPHCGQVFRVRG